MINISKKSNPNIKNLKKLLSSKKERKKAQLFCAEGKKIVVDISEKTEIDSLFVSESFFKINEHLSLYSIVRKFFVCADNIITEVSKLKKNEGIIGVFKKPEFYIGDYLKIEKALFVFCEQLQDPANLGAIIRTCFCLGADALFLTDDSVDVFNPKIIRSASGYIVDLPVFYLSLKELNRLKIEYKFFLLASFIDKHKSANCLEKIRSIPPRSIVAFGNEGQGISDELKKMADEKFYIPMREGSESLNINSAVAISLFQLTKIHRK